MPREIATIQGAVDVARNGDIIEVAPGTYHEAVTVSTDGIVIRGLERNTVILDGKYRLANGFFVAANRVRIENLTVHSFTQNGIVFSGIDVADRNTRSGEVEYGVPGRGLDGYAVRWVSAYNNGLYGIYAFASMNGMITDSLVSGHPDSGVYIGQCKPCNAIVQRVTAEFNAIGYYGTNASGGVYVIESDFRNNRLGIAPNSQRTELLFPQEESFIVGNLVRNNDEPRAPAIADGFFGGGIIVGGGSRNLVAKNRIVGHDYVGVAIIRSNDFEPSGNEIRNNFVYDNGVDLAYAASGNRGAGGNCFFGNTYTSSTPPNIDKTMACGRTPTISGLDSLPTAVNAPPEIDFRRIPAPKPQETMPTAEFAREAGVTPFTPPEINSIRLPPTSR